MGRQLNSAAVLRAIKRVRVHDSGNKNVLVVHTLLLGAPLHRVLPKAFIQYSEAAALDG
jgi:hypothetical protein